MKIYSKTDPLLPVEKPEVGRKYHVAWGFNHAIVGLCVSIDEKNKTVLLRTPKTRRPFKNPVKFSDLRHLRKEQTKIENHN